MSQREASVHTSVDEKRQANLKDNSILNEKSGHGSSIEHSDKQDFHPDLAAGPLAYTDAEFNSAHLTDGERALHSRSENVDGSFSFASLYIRMNLILVAI